VGAAYGGSGAAGYGATYGGAGFSPSTSAVGAGYAGAMGDASKSESYFGDAAANAYGRFPPQQQTPFAGRGGYSGYNR